MARTTKEIRQEKERLITEVDKIRTDLEKALRDGPHAKIRMLVQECAELGHPNIGLSDTGGFHRKVCPDCGHYEYI